VSRLKPGDTIICHVRDLQIISPYAEYYDSFTFEILSSDNTGYFVYVPDYIVLKGTTKIDKNNIRALGINKKFIGCFVVYVPDSVIVCVKTILDGEVCKECNEFYHQAEPNQEDGSMICWNCKNYPHYH